MTVQLITNKGGSVAVKKITPTFLELMFFNIIFGAFHVIKILLFKKWLTYLKERKSLEDQVD
jgi:hypothetical protein